MEICIDATLLERIALVHELIQFILILVVLDAICIYLASDLMKGVRSKRAARFEHFFHFDHSLRLLDRRAVCVLIIHKNIARLCRAFAVQPDLEIVEIIVT